MRKWLPLIAGIAAYDTWLMATGRESLSSSFKRTSREHPVFLSLGVGYLLGHLYGVLPVQSDAFAQLIEALSSRGEVLDAGS